MPGIARGDPVWSPNKKLDMPCLDELARLVREEFASRFGSRPEVVAAAPGRINIIGEHTDYNGGLAMPGAIDRWVCAAIARRDDSRIIARSQDFGSEFEFSPGRAPRESWQRYLAGILSVFGERFALPGMNILIKANLPAGKGLGSSAALEMSVLNALRELCSAEIDDLSLVILAQRVEHEHLGLSSGLLDQFASGFSRKGELMVVDFASLERRYLAGSSEDWCWILVDSGVKRELVASEYAGRAEECRRGLDAMIKAGLPVANFRDITPEHLEAIPPSIPRSRIRHFVNENQRVLAAEDCLCQGDFPGLGNLLVASHKSLREDYEVSCPELDFLVEAAIDHPGCAGSRMMGGGFGGCTVNLVRADGAEDFLETIPRVYARRFGRDSTAYRVRLVDGAGSVNSAGPVWSEAQGAPP